MRSVFRVLPDSIRVSVIITDFCLQVYTIRQKNSRTKVRAPANVKMPLKAHENNVTLNLCSAESAIFTSFHGFPCPYLLGKETLSKAKVIAPSKSGKTGQGEKIKTVTTAPAMP